MPDSKNSNSCIVNTVSCDVTAIAKFDDPFPELFGQVIDHPAKTGMCAEHLHALADRFARTARGIGALRAQKVPEPLQIPDCRRSKSYL